MRRKGHLKKIMKKWILLGFLIWKCKNSKDSFYTATPEEISKQQVLPKMSKSIVTTNLNELLKDGMIGWTIERQEFSRYTTRKFYINYDNLKPTSLMKKK